MAERIAAAFAAGLVSIAFPCVLPLVPGYLSAISAVEVDRLGERGVAKRVVLASVPFAIGFTIVFVVLGAAAAARTASISSKWVMWREGSTEASSSRYARSASSTTSSGMTAQWALYVGNG